MKPLEAVSGQIRFGIRQSFDCLEQFESRYKEIRVPIELALPHKMQDYQRVRPCLMNLATQLKAWGTQVLCVHAPQGRITDPDFLSWASETGRFADAIEHETPFHVRSQF